MLEIYSEVCRDLLTLAADRKQGLLIREDPKIGFYRKIYTLNKMFLTKSQNLIRTVRYDIIKF